MVETCKFISNAYYQYIKNLGRCASSFAILSELIDAALMALLMNILGFGFRQFIYFTYIRLFSSDLCSIMGRRLIISIVILPRFVIRAKQKLFCTLY